MRTLNQADMNFNQRDFTNFIKNIEERKLSSKRTQELKMVSDRFSQAKEIHGKAKLISRNR